MRDIEAYYGLTYRFMSFAGHYRGIDVLLAFIAFFTALSFAHSVWHVCLLVVSFLCYRSFRQVEGHFFFVKGVGGVVSYIFKERCNKSLQGSTVMCYKGQIFFISVGNMGKIYYIRTRPQGYLG